MGVAAYSVVKRSDGWAIDHDGRAEGAYATKEAAFEAIAGVASNAIKQGHEVRIHVPGGDGGPALGSD
ncbi:MAG: DUF2188 domain-containing protein [Hyphomicrobiales bacterium]|nr:DUF2188 domain-containing protein [Hyphomicrobiales bacterium]